jgi:hypothetical protein
MRGPEPRIPATDATTRERSAPLAIPARTRLARLLAGASENTSQSAMARLPAEVLDLHVDGVGTVPLPVRAPLARKLVAASTAAHFGEVRRRRSTPRCATPARSRRTGSRSPATAGRRVSPRSTRRTTPWDQLRSYRQWRGVPRGCRPAGHRLGLRQLSGPEPAVGAGLISQVC